MLLARSGQQLEPAARITSGRRNPNDTGTDRLVGQDAGSATEGFSGVFEYCPHISVRHVTSYMIFEVIVAGG